MPLDFKEIQHVLNDELPSLNFYGLEEVDSTNSFLKTCGKDDALALCVCNKQLAGYGQRERKWLSNQNSLTFSVLIHLDLSLHESNGLAQYIGLRICALLNNLSSERIYIKWPNDLFSNQGKLAGMLIETCSTRTNNVGYILGLGINLSILDSFNNTQYEQAILKTDMSRESLILLLVKTMIDSSHDFVRLNPIDFPKLFTKHDYFTKGQKVIVYHSDQSVFAEYIGLNSLGEVCVRINNQIRCYQSGDTSIREVSNE